jgi:hypothetical protein
MSNGIDTNKPILDHVVFNVRFAMDDASTAFSQLGFMLTERGYHTLGSINHLMILQSDYIELIGLPHGHTTGRADICDAAYGLNGLVFKSDDVDATYAHLQTLDMAGDPPKSFSRPVEIDGQTVNAKFRTVAVRTGVFPAGRVYFCEHGTPELVWRPEWRAHSNGAHSLEAFLIAASNPEEEAARYGSLLNLPVATHPDGVAIDLTDSTLLFMGQEQINARFGPLAPTPSDAHPTFLALRLRTPYTAAQIGAEVAAIGGISTHKTSDALVVRVNEFDALMEFVSL